MTDLEGQLLESLKQTESYLQNWVNKAVTNDIKTPKKAIYTTVYQSVHLG
jgi:hypothetical protein